jgi:hypothetical protein
MIGICTSLFELTEKRVLLLSLLFTALTDSSIFPVTLVLHTLKRQKNLQTLDGCMVTPSKRVHFYNQKRLLHSVGVIIKKRFSGSAYTRICCPSIPFFVFAFFPAVRRPHCLVSRQVLDRTPLPFCNLFCNYKPEL